MNILDEIESHADPDAIAVVEGARQISYRELLEAGKALSSSIPNDLADHRPRVALRLGDGIDYIVASLAVLRSGACLVPVPDQLAPPEVDDLLRSTACHYLIADESYDFPEPARPLGHPSLGEALAISPLPTIEAPFPEAELEACNPCFVRFSSGTTGSSKGVVISHQTLADRVAAANAGLEIGAGDRVLWVLPMAHHFAVSIMLYLRSGATTVIETSPLGEDLYATARDQRCTVIYGSPYHYRSLAGFAGAAPLPDLRLAVVTAAALDGELAAGFRDTFGLPLTQALGVIEVGLPIINLRAAADQPGALGQALPSYQIKITDPSGTELPDGEIGELLIRGPGMLDAYLEPWSPAAECLRDGFFWSGDLASRSPDDGTIQMHGRTKSVINVGGMKVFPEEVEAVLNTHPDIALSRVGGVDHPIFGAFPSAELVPADPEAAPPKLPALNKWCAAHLATYKTPKRFTWVDEIPLTPSGKIRRNTGEA